jgi:hypothetical protein
MPLQSLFEIDSKAKELDFTLFKNKLETLFQEMKEGTLGLGTREEPFLFSSVSDVDYFFSGIEKLNDLKELDLSFVSFKEGIFIRFLQELNKTDKIKALLWENVHSSEITSLVKYAPQFLKKIKGVDFSGDKTDHFFLKSFKEFLDYTSLELLALDERKIDDRDVSLILENNESLKYLSLSKNDLTGAVFESLLKSGQKIEVLDLSFNRIKEINRVHHLMDTFSLVDLNVSQNPLEEGALVEFYRQCVDKPFSFLFKKITLDISSERGYSKGFLKYFEVVSSLLNLSQTLKENPALLKEVEPQEFYDDLNVIENQDVDEAIRIYNESLLKEESTDSSFFSLSLIKRFFTFEAHFKGKQSFQEAVLFVLGEEVQGAHETLSPSENFKEVIQRSVPRSFVLYEKNEPIKCFGPWITMQNTKIKNFEEPLFFYTSRQRLSVVLKPKKLTSLKRVYGFEVFENTKGVLTFGKEDGGFRIDEGFQLEVFFEKLKKLTTKVTLDFHSASFEKKSFEKLMVLLERADFIGEIIFSKKTLLEFNAVFNDISSFASKISNIGVLGDNKETLEEQQKILAIIEKFTKNKKGFGVSLEYFSLTAENLRGFVKKPFKNLNLSANLIDDQIFSSLEVQNELEDLDLSYNVLTSLNKIWPIIERAPLTYLDLRGNNFSENEFKSFIERIEKKEELWPKAHVLMIPQEEQTYSKETLKRWDTLSRKLNWVTDDS